MALSQYRGKMSLMNIEVHESPISKDNFDADPGDTRCEVKSNTFFVFCFCEHMPLCLYGNLSSMGLLRVGGTKQRVLVATMPGFLRSHHTTTREWLSEKYKTGKSRTQVLASSGFWLCLPGGRLGPHKRAGSGKRVEQKWRHLADWKGPHCGGITFYYWSLSRGAGERHPDCLGEKERWLIRLSNKIVNNQIPSLFHPSLSNQW